MQGGAPAHALPVHHCTHTSTPACPPSPARLPALRSCPALLPCAPALRSCPALPSCLQFRDIRLKGGDVSVSFGGAAGQELAQAITDIDQLVGGWAGGRLGGWLVEALQTAAAGWLLPGCLAAYHLPAPAQQAVPLVHALESPLPLSPVPALMSCRCPLFCSPVPPCLLPAWRQVAAYQGAIDLYKLRWIDFDVEGQAVAQPASVDRRNQAIKRLQVCGVAGWRAACAPPHTVPALPLLAADRSGRPAIALLPLLPPLPLTSAPLPLALHPPLRATLPTPRARRPPTPASASPTPCPCCPRGLRPTAWSCCATPSPTGCEWTC